MTALKVTGVPLHILFALALTDMAGVTPVMIVIKTGRDETVFVITQVALLVRTHITWSPFTRVEELKVALLVPTFKPFTFH